MPLASTACLDCAQRAMCHAAQAQADWWGNDASLYPPVAIGHAVTMVRPPQKSMGSGIRPGDRCTIVSVHPVWPTAFDQDGSLDDEARRGEQESWEQCQVGLWWYTDPSLSDPCSAPPPCLRWRTRSSCPAASAASARATPSCSKTRRPRRAMARGSGGARRSTRRLAPMGRCSCRCRRCRRPTGKLPSPPPLTAHACTLRRRPFHHQSPFASPSAGGSRQSTAPTGVPTLATSTPPHRWAQPSPAPPCAQLQRSGAARGRPQQQQQQQSQPGRHRHRRRAASANTGYSRGDTAARSATPS